MSVRKGDKVVVICGKDKGKEGKIIRVDRDNGRVTVEGVNVVVKHKKARKQGEKATREKKAAPIDVSNVMILCKCGKATRIGHKIENGKKNRVCVKCGEVLDRRFVKVKDKVEAISDDDKKEEKVDKKPLVRREVKAVAESKIKKPQSTKDVKKVTGVRRMGGGA